MENQPNLEIQTISKKVVILGEGGVGKTTLLLRYITNKFSESTLMTIGSDFYVKKIKSVKNNIETRLKLLLWDFAGEKRFRFLLNDYIKGSDAIIIAFDLSRSLTLYNFADWIDVLKTAEDYEDKKPLLFLIGTKKDLIKDIENTVDYDYIKNGST